MFHKQSPTAPVPLKSKWTERDVSSSVVLLVLLKIRFVSRSDILLCSCLATARKESKIKQCSIPFLCIIFFGLSFFLPQFFFFWLFLSLGMRFIPIRHARAPFSLRWIAYSYRHVGSLISFPFRCWKTGRGQAKNIEHLKRMRLGEEEGAEKRALVYCNQL